MNDRSHLSIGEVLSLLQQDFPDVTISKIRFLESQGLLDPERTPSGYRKFYDSDIVRLQWILRQQRENFLPLRVIKERLASGTVDFEEDASLGGDEVGAVVHELVIAPALDDDLDGLEGLDEDDLRDDRDDRDDRDGDTHPATPESGSGRGPNLAALLQEAPTPREGGSPVHTALPPLPTGETPLFDRGATVVSLTLDELMAATGLSAREVGDLERFGMLAGRSLGSTNYYDHDALLVARLAAAFRGHGIEARHLRMYKVAAEREAGVFEQLLIPLSRKRSPQARREATDLVNELADLGDALRTAMLRMLLRDYLDGS